MFSADPDAATAADTGLEEMPGGLRSMWRLCRLGYRHDTRLPPASLPIPLLSACSDSLVAVWLTLFGAGLLRSDHTLVYVAAGGLAVSAAATWFLATVSTRVQRRFRDKVTIALEGHVARLQASISTIAHQERPALLD